MISFSDVVSKAAVAIMLVGLPAPVSAEPAVPGPPLLRADAMEAQASATRHAEVQGTRLFGSPTDQGEVLIINQRLDSLIRDFAKRHGIRADVSRQIRGNVGNLRLPLEPKLFLTELSQRYQIEWYFEDETLHVSDASESTTRMIGLRDVEFGQMRNELRQAGLNPDRFDIKHMKSSNAVLVSGPPSLIARIELVMESLVNNSPNRGDITMYKFGIPQSISVE